MRATLKSTLLLFEGTFSSSSGGAKKTYIASDEARKLLGQATSARVSLIGSEWSTNCQVTVLFFDSANPKVRPSEIGQGYAAFDNSGAITNPAPAPFAVDGPFCDNVDILMDVEASTGSAVESWTGAIYATLFFN